MFSVIKLFIFLKLRLQCFNSDTACWASGKAVGKHVLQNPSRDNQLT